MDPGLVEALLKTIDCNVMGSRTYETALRFAAQGLGWSYGDKATFVLTGRKQPGIRDGVEFHSGDLERFVNGHLRPSFRNIRLVGGGEVSAECLSTPMHKYARIRRPMHPASLRCSSLAYRNWYAALVAPRDPGASAFSVRDRIYELGYLDAGSPTKFRYSILPILIGDGIPFFEKLERDMALHLEGVKACKSGMVELPNEVRKPG